MKTDTLRGRDFIATHEFTREELDTLLDVALDLKRRFAMGEDHELLHNRTLFMLFYNASLRTRNSFEAGMTQLGGHAHFLAAEEVYSPAMPGEEKKSSSERISDSARVLSRMGHGIAIRCCGTAVNQFYRRGHQLIREFARWSDIPVISMEDDVYHPCQGMADLLTLKEKLGSLQARKFVMSWAYAPDHLKPVSVAHSALSLVSRYGMDVVLAHPEGFELDPEIIKQVEADAQASGGSFKIINDMAEAVTGADVIYAKSWSSLRYLPPAMDRVDENGLAALFDANRKGWTANTDIMKRANPAAIYMHCLPCARGFEVTDEVADGPQSVIFDQAENRLHAQKAIMAMTMHG